jgi:hypothetical protein
MGAVADWLHAKGFKMGLYADRGAKPRRRTEPHSQDGRRSIERRDRARHRSIERRGDIARHRRGLEVGAVFDVSESHARGIGYKTCAFRPGSRGREAQHAAQFASWGVDYLKYDSCFSPNFRRKGALEDYGTMRDALNATGRADQRPLREKKGPMR